MGEHARLSPSAAHRWMNCPGSVALSEGIPETSSAYADEGTMLHDAVKALLERGAKSRDVESTHSFATIESAELRAEYEELMRSCLSVFWARFDPTTDVALIEKRVYFPGEPDIWGTADVILIGRGRIEVIDWKFGRGVEVEAEDNPQLAIYAIAAADNYSFLIEDSPTLLATIYQPRVGAPKEWSISANDLDVLNVEIHRAARPGDKLNDGDWCRFCPAKAICPKLGETALAAARNEFDDLTLAAYTSEQVAEAVAAIPRIEAWIKAIEAEGMRRAVAHDLPGFKIVEGRMGNRQWKNRTEATDWVNRFVGENGYSKPEMLSIAQLEKLDIVKQRGGIPATLIHREPGGAHLAPVSDKRPALPAAAADFEVLE